MTRRKTKRNIHNGVARGGKASKMGVKKRKKQVLGRGLDALIPGGEPAAERSQKYFQCDIDVIHPNPYQPRAQFAEEELRELSQSITEQGIIQPLLVRKATNGYELIAGERRLRAAKMAGLDTVPVVVRDISEAELLEMSLVENIQRADLNPVEEAEAYHRLMAEFGLTQEATARRVGKSRPAVANILRIRQLPEPIKASLIGGTISAGHARALLAIGSASQQLRAWKEVTGKRLSVRDTERLVKRLGTRKKKRRPSPAGSTDLYLSNLADELTRHFGTKVSIKRRGQRGNVQIEFYTDDDLDRLIHLLRPS